MFRHLLAPLTLALLLAGCGDDPCETAGKKMCEKACACESADGKCRIGDENVQISFDDESDCKALFVTFGCGGDSNIDFEACSEALDTAQCVDVGDGNRALMDPDVCDDTSQQ